MTKNESIKDNIEGDVLKEFESLMLEISQKHNIVAISCNNPILNSLNDLSKKILNCEKVLIDKHFECA